MRTMLRFSAVLLALWTFQVATTRAADVATRTSERELRVAVNKAEKRFLDIRHWNEPERGGHFAAFEQPELFVNELRSFFRQVR